MVQIRSPVPEKSLESMVFSGVLFFEEYHLIEYHCTSYRPVTIADSFSAFVEGLFFLYSSRVKMSRRFSLRLRRLEGGNVTTEKMQADGSVFGEMSIATAVAGLRVQYPRSGMTRRLDSAVRQNVLDGVRALNNDILRQLGNEYGADGVEISAHALCAADHLPYQGRQFSNREFQDIQNRLDRPFGMWNCKHTVFPIILGVSEPAHTEEELAAYRRNSSEAVEIGGRTMTRYEWTQEQRRIETAVRYQKDIAIAAKASGDDFARREAHARINDLQKRYARISEAAGLTEQPERMAVAGFRRVKTVAELKNPPKPDIINLPNIKVWKSVGAKNINSDVLDLLTGERYHISSGRAIRDVQVFAGKGVRTPYRNAYKYAEKYGGKEEDWQHVKGKGYIDYYGEERLAEIHWSRCEGIGDVDRFLKRWLDED